MLNSRRGWNDGTPPGWNIFQLQDCYPFRRFGLVRIYIILVNEYLSSDYSRIIYYRQIYELYVNFLYSHFIFRLDLAHWNSLLHSVFRANSNDHHNPRGLENHFPVLLGVMENGFFIFHRTQEDWKMVFQSSWTMMVNGISTENVVADHSNKPNPKL